MVAAGAMQNASQKLSGMNSKVHVETQRARRMTNGSIQISKKSHAKIFVFVTTTV